MNIKLKRAYDTPDPTDGFRVLVDRIWPRGISKEDLKVDLWLKDIAPSAELRKWFNHDPEKFERFSSQYQQELMNNEETVQELLSHMEEHQTITFVYAAKDQEHNNAVVLKDFIQKTLA